MKKLQTLTTSTAIALASVGAPVFAQEAQATPIHSNTAVNEPALVAKSQVKPLEKSEVPEPSTVKPALDAQKGVKDAEATVNEAETAFATAKKADEAREDAIKSAETDVNTKNDAVKLAKDKLTTANEHAESVEAKLQSAQDELTKAQDALKNIGKPTNIYEAINAEIVDKSGTIYFKDKTFDLTAKMNEFRRLIKEDKNVEAQKYAEENLLSSMLNLYIDDTSQQFIKALIGDEAFNKTYNLQNGKLILSREDYKALNIAFASQLNAFRKISGLEPINKVTENKFIKKKKLK